jgi:hypothetical protein
MAPSHCPAIARPLSSAYLQQTSARLRRHKSVLSDVLHRSYRTAWFGAFHSLKERSRQTHFGGLDGMSGTGRTLGSCVAASLYDFDHGNRFTGEFSQAQSSNSTLGRVAAAPTCPSSQAWLTASQRPSDEPPNGIGPHRRQPSGRRQGSPRTALSWSSVWSSPDVIRQAARLQVRIGQRFSLNSWNFIRTRA